MHRDAALDRTFQALADPTRRSMIQALSGGADADQRHEQGWNGALDLLEALLRKETRDGD